MTDSLRSIHVVAAVIVDVRGRLLLSRRTENSDMPGLWNFQGKRESGGDIRAGVGPRVVWRNLGSALTLGEWLMEVPQLYPGKRLRLEVEGGRVLGRGAAGT